MRQILYVSSKHPRHGVNVGEILTTSRRKNLAAGISGLLYTDGTRFLQVIEGEADTIQTTFDRIKRDLRHHAVVILADRQIDAPEFGNWAMAHRLASDEPDVFDARLARMLATASENIRGTFMGLIAARKAA